MHEHDQSAESYADRLDFASKRLQGIAVSHTEGDKALARGWGSILIDADKGKYILSPELVYSSQTPYETFILLVPPEFLGTHEKTDPEEIPAEGQPKRGFEGIDFSGGWNGSPLACACFVECKGNEIVKSTIYPDIRKKLMEHLGDARVEGVAMAVLDLDEKDYGNFGVLDGHHRRKYAEKGPIKLKYVPIQIIPYLYDGSVVLRTWHANNRFWDAEQVFLCFKNRDENADAKRTKFGVIGKDGVIRRILDTQPNIKIPLENLI